MNWLLPIPTASYSLARYSMSPLKNVRLRLRTGDLVLRKDVEEFLVGRKYFVLIAGNTGTETFPVDNIISVDYMVNGEYVRISHLKGR